MVSGDFFAAVFFAAVFFAGDLFFPAVFGRFVCGRAVPGSSSTNAMMSWPPPETEIRNRIPLQEPYEHPALARTLIRVQKLLVAENFRVAPEEFPQQGGSAPLPPEHHE